MEEEQDIQSDIVKQKQLRDAQKYKSFSQEIKAINKADKAGNLTDQDRIEGHKRASNIYRGIEEQSSGSPVGDDIITKARLTFNKLSPYVPVVKQIREIFKPWFDTDSRGNITFNPNKVTAENYLESTGNLIKYQIQNPGMGYLPASEDPALTQYSGQIDTIKKQRFTPEQIIALKDQILRQVNPDQGDLFEAAKLAQYQKDMRNPNISLPVRVDLANSVLGSSYRTSEPFDYFKFREQSKYMRDKGRRFLAYFQAGLTQYGASKATSFDIYRKQTTPKLEQEYKKGSPLSSFQIQYKEALKVLYNSNSKPEEIEAALKTINDPQVQGLPSSSFQVHHKAALKAIMGISHGLDFDSPVFREVMGIIIEEIPWLGLGDESTNLMPIIGSTADRGTPHYLAHRFYNKILGPKGQGEEFFTEEVVEQMMVNREFRKEKAREIGQIIKRSNDIVTRATRLWELGFSNKHHFKSLDHLVDNLSQFDELGYEELSDPNYEAPIVTAIIDEIVRDGQLLPPVEKNERRQQILQDLLRLKELDDDERSADAQRKRDLKGPDNPDQEELF